MGSTFIPFGKWSFDSHGAGNTPRGYESIAFVYGLLPVSRGGYRPIYVFSDTAASGITSTYEPTSAFLHRIASSSYADTTTTYIGTAGDIWEGTTNVTKTAAGTYATEAAAATLTQHPFAFLSWGDAALATNYSSHVQRQTTRGARFADCITITGSSAKPKARLISSLGQHVVLANIYVAAGCAGGTGLSIGAHPSLVWWSKTDDATGFSDPATDVSWNSDYQDLPDLAGPITGLVKISDEALVIFKREGSYLMSRTGDSQLLFSFQVLHAGVNAGCASPASIVVIGRDIYYVSQSGHACVMRNLGQPERLSAYTLWQYAGTAASNQGFSSTGESVPYSIGATNNELRDDYRAAYEPVTETIVWTRDVNVLNGVSNCNVNVVYNVASGAFSAYTRGSGKAYGCWLAYADQNSTYLHAYHRANPITYDRMVFPTGSGVALSAWAVRTGLVNLQPIEPEALGIGPSLAVIKRVRPVGSGSLPFSLAAPTIRIGAYQTINANTGVDPDDTGFAVTTLDPATYPVNERGWYTVPAGGIVGNVFNFEVSGATSIGGYGWGYDSLLGLEVDAESYAAR